MRLNGQKFSENFNFLAKFRSKSQRNRYTKVSIEKKNNSVLQNPFPSKKSFPSNQTHPKKSHKNHWTVKNSINFLFVHRLRAFGQKSNCMRIWFPIIHGCCMSASNFRLHYLVSFLFPIRIPSRENSFFSETKDCYLKKLHCYASIIPQLNIHIFIAWFLLLPAPTIPRFHLYNWQKVIP